MSKSQDNLEFCIDISDIAPPSGDVYFDARHHNAKGNKIIANEIHETLAIFSYLWVCLIKVELSQHSDKYITLYWHSNTSDIEIKCKDKRSTLYHLYILFKDINKS